jgi:site-specific DNA-adenine methylase
MLGPFQLIREYDFDDSVIKVENLETPSPGNVKIAGGTVNLHTDHDFTKDSKFVYSVCAIDAHGMTSNYSSQIELSFDRSKNHLNKQMLSVSGAPKSYPNMYIRNDLFEDTMKTSGRQKLTVYFNPEYLEVTKQSGSKLGLLATDTNNGTYRLQIINTDLQKASSVDISLKNLRTDN